MRLTLRSDWANRQLQLGLLRMASFLVPQQQRAEWRREWWSELWHVRQACAASGALGCRDDQRANGFCLGAFEDALWLRRSGKPHTACFVATEGTPARCLLVMAGLLAASYAVALLLPGVRAERSLWPSKVNPNAVLIQQADYSGSMPTVTADEFRAWNERRQKYFDALAFYHVAREQESAWSDVPDGHSHATSTWAVAHATKNLFESLGLTAQFAEPGLQAGGSSDVWLSESAWKRLFGADPHVAGTVLWLGGRSVRIAGVAPDGALGLPGGVDAWLLEQNAARESKSVGYAVGRLNAEGQGELWSSCVRITANGPGDSKQDLMGVLVDSSRPGTGALYGFAALLALLSVPAITAVSLGEYSADPQETSWGRKLYRWGFFAAKVALLMPMVYFVALDLAYGFTSLSRDHATETQLAASFAMCLFGMRWVLKDQRRRCPVCLRCVAHPAQVGQASRTFLAWNGTEMMCMGGHTLLHVPSLPTSWFSSQRWLYLDPSWAFLFASSAGTMDHEVIGGLSNP